MLLTLRVIAAFPPAAIRLLLDAKEGVPIAIEPGITLVISPEQLGVSRDVELLQRRLSSVVSDLFKSHPEGAVSDDNSNG